MTFTPEEIRTEIRRLVARITERREPEISDTADFTQVLGMDSLMLMELMIEIDRKFRIDIQEEYFSKAKTINDAVAMVQRWLAARGGGAGA